MKEIMVPLNIQLNKNTINGRIYNIDFFEKLKNTAKTKKLFVFDVTGYPDLSEGEKPDRKHLIGMCDDAFLDFCTNEITMNLSLNALGESYFSEGWEEKIELSIFLFGDINDNNLVNVQSINHLYITQKENI